MKKPFIVLLIALSSITRFAYADEDSEREALAKIAYELERLQQVVNDASKDATSATRIKFRYDWLARDLELVRAGIDNHLDSPRQPRPVPPLKGDYRR